MSYLRNSFLTIITLFGSCMCAVCPAALMPIGSANAPTGFTDLIVSGVHYDVTFHSGSFIDTFGAGVAPDPPITFNDELGAAAAASALAAALNGMAPVPPEVGPPDHGMPNSALLVPYSATATQFSSVLLWFDNPEWASGVPTTSHRTWDWANTNISRWAPASGMVSTPIPGTALLGIIGLAASAHVLRRKRKKTMGTVSSL
jgi:hypothetical protein